MAAPAKAAGKKKPDIDEIMPIDDIKSLLARARRGTPANCLIGATSDDEALIYLDRRKSPKQLVGVVQRAAVTAGIGLNRSSLRYGHISFKKADGGEVSEADSADDADETGKVLHIVVNKEPMGGLPLKLRDRLKRAGCARFEIHVDSKIELEPEDAPDAPASAAPQPQPAPAAAAAAPQTVPQAAAPDAAAAMAPISARLVALMKQLPAVIQSAPGQRDMLVQLATAASTAVRGGDAHAADMALAALVAAVEAVRQAPTGSQGAAVPLATLAKSRAIWVATRAAVEKQLDTLHGKMAEAYQDHGFGAELEKFFRAKVEPVLGTLDDSLVHILDDVGTAKDAAAQKQLLQSALATVRTYENYLAGEKLIRQLDENPFMPLQIEATLTRTLEALGRTIATVNGALV